MKELKLLKYATITFMVFILFWVEFGGYILGTQGSKKDPEPVQTKQTYNNYRQLEVKEEDATILGKFWNKDGHFIVVYDGTTKAPKILEVDLDEWELIDIGELY